MVEKVTLKSASGESYQVDREVAEMSTLLKNVVDDTGCEEDIPLPNVKSPILEKVIEYCKHHRQVPAEEIQKPLKCPNLKECGVSEWDDEFVNMEQEVG